MLGEKIAVGRYELLHLRPRDWQSPHPLAETNLGDFVADGIYTYFNEVEQLHCDIAIMNGGGIRADVNAGYWTFKTCEMVSPFGNVACLMSVTGMQIQDALEFAARFAGESEKENGGFLHVAGASYEIHTDIPNTVQTDEKNVWIGSATGTPRVQNVKIYDKASGSYLPLDPGATYALAGMNYTLRNLGDGFAMFDGAELIKDYVSEDYLVMSTYAMIFGGVDAEGLPHLSNSQQPAGRLPGLSAGLRESLRRRPHQHSVKLHKMDVPSGKDGTLFLYNEYRTKKPSGINRMAFWLGMRESNSHK